MAFNRQVTFWVAALAVLVALLWLLSEILLPFVAGMALAYLLDPIARRAERLGIGRAVSALFVITSVIVALVVVTMLVGPILVAQFASLVDWLPGYLARLQELVADSGRPWLMKLVGGPLPDGSKALGDIVSQGSGWIATFLKSLWSGGRAVFSVLSLLVITPVVAFYCCAMGSRTRHGGRLDRSRIAKRCAV
jgi:predicted PurR-regulated permease PerM